MSSEGNRDDGPRDDGPDEAGGREEERREQDDGDGGLSEGVAVLISAAVGFAVAIAVTWYVTAPADSFYEALFRIGPTLEGGGVGADWVAGNTIPLLDFLIALVHAADVIMGVFILIMVFLHWGAFRRLADRMRSPGEGVATDGGSPDEDGGDRA